MLIVMQAVAVEPAPPAHELRLRGGLGVGTYSESAPGVTFKADAEPMAQVALDGFVAGNDQLGFAFQATAATTTEVDMRARQNGQVTQENKFNQDLYEISPRLRIRTSARIAFEIGYRFTYQRLHINDVGNFGDVLEVVQSHAIEGGFLYRKPDPDGGRLDVTVELGLNHGWADNSLIDGDNFDAGGQQFAVRVFKTFASGLSVGGGLQLRQQNGSEMDDVTVQGQATTAFWPDNQTMSILGSIGYGL
ncbi:hypothetical protein BH11MYX2_BH11MYX2_29490 [soil metagenome]